MNLRLQKKLASKAAKVGLSRVKINPANLSDIKEAITKADVKDLIAENMIKISNKEGTSRGRARKRHLQKRKGRQKGVGKRKGAQKARTPKKRSWINKIRPQRELLSQLRAKKHIDARIYRELYLKAKGGFFRNRKHLLMYADKLIKQK